jgi:ComF family protein
MIGKYIGSLINDYLAEEIYKWRADFIIPVPLHRLKKAQRGYNQSEFIAKEISKLLDVKLKTNLIKRVKYTETQTSMNLIERRENMKDAFVQKNNADIKNRRIIILDDVTTTGATIEACGKILKEKGAAEIFALSAALTD